MRVGLTPTTTAIRRLARRFRLPISVGIVAGAVFGVREGLLVAGTNAFVQPAQYFAVYLAVPTIAWMALGAVIGAFGGLVLASIGRGEDDENDLPKHVALVVLAGALSVTLPWMIEIIDDLRQVGFTLALPQTVLLIVVAFALAAAVSATAAGAAAHWKRPLVRLLPRAAVALVVIGIPMLGSPVVLFVLTDWKLATASTTHADAATGKPNLLLISIDTLRADHLGSYGSTMGLTPHLDELAEQGLMFSQAITSAPWTLPAVASLHTGLLPHHHGAGQPTNRRDPLGRSALKPGLATIAQALTANGYQTCAIVTNPYLALRYGLGAGFDEYSNITIESEAFLAFRRTTALRLLQHLYPDAVVGDRGDTVSARAERWLANRQSSRPFFLWLHYIDPHPPYSAPGVTRHKSFRADSLLGSSDDVGETEGLSSPDVARLRSGEIRLNEVQKEHVRSLYRAEVASVDAAVGKVVSTLDRLGLSANTLVVVVADHGEEFWEHGGVEHGHTVYDELVRVPLLLRWMGHLLPGEQRHDVVSIADVAPTTLALLGIVPPTGLDGRELLAGQSHPDVQRSALVENMLFAEERVGVRTATRKYIVWQDGRREAYDLEADPKERVNLAALASETEQLQALVELTPQSADGERQGERTVLEPSTADALRSLGYLR